jgi:hypothetical protein
VIWLVGSIAYGLAGLLAARMVAGAVAYDVTMNHDSRGPGGMDWFCGRFVGLWAGAVWPVALFFVALHRLGNTSPIWLTAGRERRERERRRDRELRLREERLRQAESELGLEPWETVR